MALADLDESEREVVKECLHAAIEGPFFPDWEFQTLFGLERYEIKKILESWSEIDDSKKDVQAAISNSLGHLLGYPHGHHKEWPRCISVSSNEVLRILEKWRQNV